MLTAVHNRCARLLREFVDCRDAERRDYLAELVDDARAAMGMPPLCGPVVASESVNPQERKDR